jgi:hypothetical protein
MPARKYRLGAPPPVAPVTEAAPGWRKLAGGFLHSGDAAMLPVEETPLERVERELAGLKALPDIVVMAARPPGPVHLGPWAELGEHTKHLLLFDLDWGGVDLADRQNIEEREVAPYDIFDVYRRC